MLARRGGRWTRDDGRRRGVTLVEMLVTVAVLVILMTILVQIFQAATGSVSAARAYQELDDQLRRLDGIIRADLEGVTARFTPPLNPAQNLGYFEYGENEFADNQGEDGDDYIRFTAKAPPGQPFVGRFWPNYIQFHGVSQPLPITITSDYAEIIYFVRNGNLYRRILLVAPEMQSVLGLVPAVNNQNQNGAFLPPILQLPSTKVPVSWQGVNDLSARPSPVGSTATAIVLNSLGDLTNRENRFAYPRFADDFYNATGTNAAVDGIPDDLNGDNVPDYYPSLYPNLFGNNAPGLVFAPAYQTTQWNSLMAFPYVYPGAYSRPQALPNAGYQCGWIHAPASIANANGQPVTFDSNNALAYLQSLNHNPLDVGDNLPTPLNPAFSGNGQAMLQTWWGFPTWRETLSVNWNDPTVPLFQVANWGGGQPNGLGYGTWNGQDYPDFLTINSGTVNSGNANLLPPMVSSWTGGGGNTVFFPGLRNTDQLFCDSAGFNSQFLSATLWPLSWEDDLIMTGVRSFDVKAYDNTVANYMDLGWGDDLRLYLPYVNNLNPQIPTSPPFLQSTPTPFPWPPSLNAGSTPYATLGTFAHEGRMPPLTTDLRADASTPNPNFPGVSPLATTALSTSLFGQTNYTGNIGDNSPYIVRLRRVWDSWSTDYSQAPATGVIKSGAAGGSKVGPPFTPPVYPSYPPPYPAALRGIQIQIRVVDPSNQRIKSLTIRQDFTDKL